MHSELAALSRTSRKLNALFTPVLYSAFIGNDFNIAAFLPTILSRPDHAPFTTTASFKGLAYFRSVGVYMSPIEDFVSDERPRQMDVHGNLIPPDPSEANLVTPDELKTRRIKVHSWLQAPA